MCGIFAYTGTANNAGDLILQGLKSLEYRGYDSWGIALKESNNTIFIEKNVGKIGNATIGKHTAHIGIGHTRWATHGGVTQQNAHPHTNRDKSVIVVHNGIIENFETLRDNLKKEGYQFVSDTDTEIIPHLLDQMIKTQELSPQDAVIKMFFLLKGMNAIIVFFPEHETFFAIKNGSPLIYTKTGQAQLLASDAAALAPYATDVSFLGDNELLTVSPKKTTLTSLSGQKKKMKWTMLQYDAEDVQLGDYKHFMIKEISEQPQVLNTILESKRMEIQRFARTIRNSFDSHFIGSGTSYYACLTARYLLSKIAKKRINTSIGSEFLYMTDYVSDTSLVVALSQSGETIDILSSMKRVAETGATLGAMTNVLGSSLYRMADIKLLLNAGPEQSVCATKSFTSSIAVMLLLAHELAGTYEQGEQSLEKAIKEVDSILDNKEKIQAMAKQLAHHRNIFILGRGTAYPIALESALKIKEVSYVHAEGFAGGELKHGVIALISKNTPVIIYNPHDETFEDTLSSAHEVKARGAFVIGVSSKPNDVFDIHIPVRINDEGAIIPFVVVAQLIGYYLALEKGLDPDKPRNLAKSVTVK